MTVTLTWAGFSAKRVNIGTGGWTTGGGISDDGATLVARADVHGSYVFNDTTDEWENMIEYGKIPNDMLVAGGSRIGAGTIEVCVAPSDSNIIYNLINYANAADAATFQCRVLKSTDRGATSAWTAIFPGAQPAGGNGNGIWRQYGPKMAVDPVNPNVVIAGLQHYGATTEGGTYLTTDGGSTWTNMNTAGLPKAKRGVDIDGDPNHGLAMTGFLFDRGSVSGGRCQTIYAFAGGVGFYRSTNGGTSWTLFANLATVPHVADIQQSTVDNKIYLAADGDLLGGVAAKMGWRIVSGTLTALPVPDFQAATCLMPHPTLAGCVVAMTTVGDMNISYDSGATWAGWRGYYLGDGTTLTSPDAPWLAATAGAGFQNTNRAIIDRSTGKTRSGKTIVFGGDGVTRSASNVPSSGVHSASAVFMTKGIELLCVTSMARPVGGKFQITVQDRRNFSIGDSEVRSSPSSHGFFKWNTGNSIEYGTDCTWAKSNPSFLCGCAGYVGFDEGYSLDGGATWNAWPTDPPRANGAGVWINGCMAAATDQNIIWWPTNRHAPFYTKNRGTTWLPLNVGGNTGEGDWLWDAHSTNILHKHFIDADNVNIGTYLLHIYGTGVFDDGFTPNPASAAVNGLWLSNNLGDTWTRIRAGNLISLQYHPKLRHVNGVAGAYLFTGGAQDTAGSLLGSLFKIQVAGGGTGTGVPTVTTYPGVVEPMDFAIGKLMPGKAWPRIWFIGWLNPSATSPKNADNAAFGLYYTDDADLASPTWTKALATPFPLNRLDGMTGLAASTEIADLAIIGYAGSGCIEVSRP